MRSLWSADIVQYARADDALARDLRRNGSVILSVFACIWALGVPGLDSPVAQIAVIVMAVVLTVSTIVLAVRAHSSPEDRTPPRLPVDWGRRYNMIGLVESVAIAIAVIALIWLDQPALIPAVVCLIVGIHFVPLAHVFGQRQYRWSAVALCALAIVGVVALMTMDASASRLVVGIGAAAILWTTSAHLSLVG